VHQAFARGIGHLGLKFLVPEPERLMTLNTVRVPEGVNEAEVRTALRERFSIEIGAGMGPLAGKIWRIGLMGASASEAHVHTLVGALRAALPHP
jgi:alanine-glyoxylate transaminase/serine-glyoxylate transaminase/serine-pyruvate transaminase